MTPRSWLLALIALGIVGLSTELVLLEHFEDGWQLVPLFLLAQAAVAVAWQAVAPSMISTRFLQGTMTLVAIAGAAGVYLHFRGNLEFQLEIDATQSGWDLFRKVMHAKAPPALAPGAMTQLGLLGLIYAFRHPALAPQTDDLDELR